MADDLKQRLLDAYKCDYGLYNEAAARIEALEDENSALKAEKAAEVAHADRLAEALTNVLGAIPTDSLDDWEAPARQALADHRARRGG